MMLLTETTSRQQHKTRTAFSAIMLLASCGVFAIAFDATAQTADIDAAQHPLAIKPMTHIGPNAAGYMADPQPIHRAPHGLDEQGELISGTTKALLHCPGPIQPGCFSSTPITVKIDALRNDVAAAGPGAKITNLQNINIFQDDAGAWHAAVTVGIRTNAHPQHWTVVTHAHPTAATEPGRAPLTWAVDTILKGSLQDPLQGNYDAKYYEEDGKLYLLNVYNYVPQPALRNEITLQPMLSPRQAAPVAPTVLLAPGDRYGPLNSEWYGHTPAKLVEAPYISRIGGKYALVYSTGAYLTPGYKAGVAWSDTLFPSPGEHYRKVLEPDPAGVWGTPGAMEVHYLLQSATRHWPNYTGDEVIAPGVASAIQAANGVWRLYFNGYKPGDMPVNAGPVVEGSHRRPYFVRLRASVPEGRPLSSVSDAELATWLTPKPQ